LVTLSDPTQKNWFYVCRIQGPYAVIKGLGRIAQGSKGNKPIVTPVDILQKKMLL